MMLSSSGRPPPEVVASNHWRMIRRETDRRGLRTHRHGVPAASSEYLRVRSLLPHARGVQEPGARRVLGSRVARRKSRLCHFLRELDVDGRLARVHVLQRADGDLPECQGPPELARSGTMVRELSEYDLSSDDRQDGVFASSST